MNKKIIYNLFLITIFSATVLFISCDDTVTNADIDEVVIPSENVSYAKYIQPLFNVKCTTSGCHNEESMAGGYSLTSWSNAVIPGIIDPGNVQTSRLVWRIEGQGYPLMPPPTRGYLTPNQREGIKTWIREGAKNN